MRDGACWPDVRGTHPQVMRSADDREMAANEARLLGLLGQVEEAGCVKLIRSFMGPGR